MSSRGFTTDASVLTIADHQLQSCIEDALRDSGYSALRSIAVRVHEGMVLLDGKVTTYYLKQFAQSLVLQIDGVQQLHNRIEVI